MLVWGILVEILLLLIDSPWWGGPAASFPVAENKTIERFFKLVYRSAICNEISRFVLDFIHRLIDSSLFLATGSVAQKNGMSQVATYSFASVSSLNHSWVGKRMDCEWSDLTWMASRHSSFFCERPVFWSGWLANDFFF